MFTKIISFISRWIIPTWLLMLVSALIAGAGAWKVQDYRIGALKEGYVTQALLQEQKHRQKELDWTAHIQGAMNEAAKREQSLRITVASTRNVSNRLRTSLATLKQQLPELAQAACVERANTLSNIFGSCIEEYAAMGESCDRHVSDKRTLIEAWPK